MTPVLCVCVVCGQYGKQLQCNYQLSKLAPKSLEGSRLTDGKVRSSDTTQRWGTVGKRAVASHFCLSVCVCVVYAVEVGGQPGGHGLLGEGRWTGHPEPDGGPERREGGGASLEGELAEA